MRWLSFVVKFCWRLAYFILAVAIVAGLVIIFGRLMLDERLPGSDNNGFITYASWFLPFLPKIPFWYPQQGAGISYVSYYPILSHLLLLGFSRLSQLNLVIAFRILALLTVLITSLGIYGLGWRLTKNQTVGLLAAIFYPISAIAWIWLLEWGFTAESFSYMLIGPTLIWLDLYWSETKASKRQRLYLFLLVIFAALLLLTHPFSLTGTLLLIGLWLIFKSAKNWKKAVATAIKLTGLVALVAAFWLVPFNRYANLVANKSGKTDKAIDRQRILQNGIHWKNYFGLTKESALYESIDQPAEAKSNYNWRDVNWPLPVSILALIGFAGAIWLNRNLLALGLANASLLFIALSPRLTYWLKQLPLLNFIVEWRVLVIPSRIVIPILAGFGAYTIAYLISWPLKRLKWWPLGLLMLAISGGLLYWFKNWPDYPRYQLAYGADVGKRLDLRNIWQQEFDVCAGLGKALIGEAEPLCLNQKLIKYFWPNKLLAVCKGSNLLICRANPGEGVILAAAQECEKKPTAADYESICQARIEPSWQQLINQNYWRKWGIFQEGAKELLRERWELVEKIPDDKTTRMDTAGMGELLMSSQYYTVKPQLSVYHNLSSLISQLWNYQMTVFYDPKTSWSQPEIVDELAKYFSLEYVILPEEFSPMERYRLQTWEKVAGEPEEEKASLWQFKQPVKLLTVTTRPLVLVVGQNKVDAYFRIFHLANLGTIPFDEAILVKGKENIDEYTAEELKKFELVILEGYQYKKLINRDKAFKEMEKYVRSGGSLFISTGWQYTSADWQLNKTPEFFPTTELKWTDAGQTSNYLLESSEIGAGVDAGLFGPLDYHGNAWGISSTEKENLREWAKVILSAKGKVLAAGGELGQGRVIWTGLDFPGHISTYKDNPQEVKFYGNLIKYLLKGKTKKDVAAEWMREYPDRVEITINEIVDKKVGVYWSEANQPDFKARLIEPGIGKAKRLAVYKAGPGMSLFILPKVEAGTKIVFEYQAPLIVLLARLVSMTTFILLIISIFKPIRFKVKIKWPKMWLKQGREEEEEY